MSLLNFLCATLLLAYPQMSQASRTVRASASSSAWSSCSCRLRKISKGSLQCSSAHLQVLAHAATVKGRFTSSEISSMAASGSVAVVAIKEEPEAPLSRLHPGALTLPRIMRGAKGKGSGAGIQVHMFTYILTYLHTYIPIYIHACVYIYMAGGARPW